MAMYAVASSSISDQSRIDIENNETMEKNAEKKCYERTFTEHDLCPFVSENYEITLNDALTETNMSLIVRKLSFSFADVAMVLRHKSGSTGDKSNDGKSYVTSVCLFACSCDLQLCFKRNVAASGPCRYIFLRV